MTKGGSADSAQKRGRKTKRDITKRFLILIVGVVLVSSGYICMLLLQSSLNIVDGLGTKITAVSYASSILFSLLVVPICIRIAGPKKSFLASEAAYIFYVIANFYPKEWTLMIAGVVAGWAEATFWVPVALLFVYYGKLYHQHSNKSEEVCVREFSGILLGMNQLNQIVGNIFVFTLLNYITSAQESTNTSSPPPSLKNASYVNQTTPYVTTSASWTNPYALCGANDCQDINTTMQNIDQYVPPNRVAVYALLSTFVVIMLSGMMIHIFFMPDFPANVEPQKKQRGDEEKLQCDGGNDARNELTSPSITENTVLAEMWITLKDVFRQVIDWRQILIYPANFYTAFSVGFLFSEATRAYASCIKGVSQVGICSMFSAVSSCVGSYFGGKALGKFGVTRVMGCITLIDLVMHLACIFWMPTESTSWLVYVIFTWLGLDHGLWNLIVTNKKELCFTMWCCIYGIGFAIQFGWSTALCVKTKLLVQIPILLLGTACVVILRRKTKQHQTSDDL